MILVPLSVVVTIFVLGAAGIVFALWLLSDLRDRTLYDLERRKGIFHCIKCDKLYAARVGTETCPCPRCQFRNTRLQF